RMLRDGSVDVYEANVLVEDILDRVNRQARSGAADEQRATFRDAIAAQLEIGHETFDHFLRQRNDAAARAASGDLDLELFEFDVGEIQCDELADANAGREEQLEDDVVEHGAEVSIGSAGGVDGHRRP